MSRLLRIRRTILSFTVLALALLVGSFVAGCQPHRSQVPSEQVLADSLVEGYQWLEEQYQRMGSAMPPAMRGMRSRMQAMHSQMMGGRSRGMGRMRQKGIRGTQEEDTSPRDSTVDPFRMGHGDMSAMHETMARMHGEHRARMAARHRRMAHWHESMMAGSSEESARTSDETSQTLDDGVRSGATLFAQQCASCHGQSGQGISGAFPPLVDSDWVTGDVSTLARIVLHGLQGPIEVNEQRYNGVMPAFGGRLSDPEVAELLTFLRTSLNKDSSPITAEKVGEIRDAYANRNRAWTSEALGNDEAPSSPSQNRD